MKVLKYALVIGAAAVAVSANAQFGAANKSELETTNTKQGLYVNYSPFFRYTANGGGTSNGYLVAAEKTVSEGKNGPGVFGGFFSRANGSNVYDITYRQYIDTDASVGIGILGGDGFNGKNDFSFLYFKDMPKVEGSTLVWQAFGGLYYSGTAKNTKLSGGVKASYPIQNGFAIDGTFWYNNLAGTTGNFVTIGVSYKF